MIFYFPMAMDAKNGRGTPCMLNYEFNIYINLGNELNGIKNAYFDSLHDYNRDITEIIFFTWSQGAKMGVASHICLRMS